MGNGKGEIQMGINLFSSGGPKECLLLMINESKKKVKLNKGVRSRIQKLKV